METYVCPCGCGTPLNEVDLIRAVYLACRQAKWDSAGTSTYEAASSVERTAWAMLGRAARGAR